MEVVQFLQGSMESLRIPFALLQASVWLSHISSTNTEDIRLGPNVALGKLAKQTCLGDSGGVKKPSWRAASAVDGRLRTISHTCASRRPWWYVDLGTNMWIHSVKVVNSGTDLCRDCWDRINPFEVTIGNSTIVTRNERCGNRTFSFPSPENDTLSIECQIYGRYAGINVVKGAKGTRNTYLHMREFEVYAPIVNGTSGWTSWNPCSVSCGSGERMRTIACLGIPRNGGYGCENVSSAMQFERHPCQMPECDGTDSGLSIGVGVGVVIIILILAVIDAYCYMKKRRKAEKQIYETPLQLNNDDHIYTSIENRAVTNNVATVNDASHGNLYSVSQEVPDYDYSTIPPNALGHSYPANNDKNAIDNVLNRHEKTKRNGTEKLDNKPSTPAYDTQGKDNLYLHLIADDTANTPPGVGDQSRERSPNEEKTAHPIYENV